MFISHMVGKACLPLLIHADPCLFSVMPIIALIILFLADATYEGRLASAFSALTLME